MEEKLLIEKILAGDTIALSKAITLCESTLQKDQKKVSLEEKNQDI